jgi:EAL domain-containing protein (putative c-di-GMP-specific phosphodiesterase class I)
MYAAKTAGRNTFRFFTASMHADAARRLGLETDLRRAIERNQLFLAYQPVVESNGKIVAVEALVRWRHPIEGVVPPSTFIPIAEKNGTIVSLGAWVARAACMQIAQWRRLIPDLRVALNVSARQFDDMRLPEVLAEALAAADLSYDALDIEVTESLVVNASSAIETLRELRCKGARVSIDDFGTGYSSLALLRRLPTDTLKIDRSFVEHLEDDKDGNSIVAAIIAVAQAMRLDVVAEGVETPGQLEALEQLGCHRFQGYYFSRPVDEGGMTELLEQGRIIP